jgi:hypothetical protein
MVQIEEINPPKPPAHAWTIRDAKDRLQVQDEDSSRNQTFAPVLSVLDAERFVEGLKEFEIEDVGSSRWVRFEFFGIRV